GEVGPSGVREAQLWVTRDSGRTWQLLAKQTGAVSPIRAKLPGEGQYGFRLVLVGGDGATAGPPQPGAEPQLLVSFETRDRVVPQGWLLAPEAFVAEPGPAPREVTAAGADGAFSFSTSIEYAIVVGQPSPIRATGPEPAPMPRELNADQRQLFNFWIGIFDTGPPQALPMPREADVEPGPMPREVSAGPSWILQIGEVEPVEPGVCRPIPPPLTHEVLPLPASLGTLLTAIGAIPVPFEAPRYVIGWSR